MAKTQRFRVRRVAPVFAVVEEGNPPKELGRYFDQKDAEEDASVRNLIYRVFEERREAEEKRG